jgi:hypothetical protein
MRNVVRAASLADGEGLDVVALEVDEDLGAELKIEFFPPTGRSHPHNRSVAMSRLTLCGKQPFDGKITFINVLFMTRR